MVSRFRCRRHTACIAFVATVAAMLLLVGATDDVDTVADTVAETSDVIVLTSSNFDELVKQRGGKWLVEFYAPWCGYCKRLAPVYELVATQLKGEVNVAKIDASDKENNVIGRRFGIRGFPTIKFIWNGSAVHDYQGDRSEESLVRWARETDWATATPTSDYPGEQTLVRDIVGTYAEVFNLARQVFVRYFWPAVGLTFFLGFLCGALVCFPLSAPRPAARPAPVPRTGAVTGPATAAAPTAAPSDAATDRPKLD